MNNIYLRVAVALVISLILHLLILNPFAKAENSPQLGSADKAINQLSTELGTSSKEPESLEAVAAKDVDAKREELDAVEKSVEQKAKKGSSEKDSVSLVVAEAKLSKTSAEKPVSEKVKEVKAAVINEPLSGDDEWSQKKNQIAASKRKLLKSRISKGSYKLMQRAMKLGKVSLKNSIPLDFVWRDEDELRSVHSFYSMQVAAFDKKNPEKVVILTQNDFGDSIERYRNFNYSHYSPNRYERTEDYFSSFLANISRQAYLQNPILMTLTPETSDKYFTFKVNKNIELMKYEKSEVKRTLASFYKTSFGHWIMKVEYLQLVTGEVIAVNDFEYRQILGPAK